MTSSNHFLGWSYRQGSGPISSADIANRNLGLMVLDLTSDNDDALTIGQSYSPVFRQIIFAFQATFTSSSFSKLLGLYQLLDFLKFSIHVFIGRIFIGNFVIMGMLHLCTCMKVIITIRHCISIFPTLIFKIKILIFRTVSLIVF